MTANHAEKILEVRGLTRPTAVRPKRAQSSPTPTLDVLKGIDIDIYRGDVVCLIGPLRLRQVHLPALPEPAGDPHRRLHQV